MAVMERLVALNPNNAAALNFVGYSWADENVNLERALDYIMRAAQLNPDSAAIRDVLLFPTMKSQNTPAEGN